MPLKEIGSFSVSYLGILDENGEVDQELEPKISGDDLLSLYRWMFLAREVDQRIADGADAARFVSELIRHLSDPNLLLLET